MYNIFIHIYDRFEKCRILLYFLLILINWGKWFLCFTNKAAKEYLQLFFDDGDKNDSNILENFRLKDRILVVTFRFGT